MTPPGAQERADQLLDDLMDHRTYDRCDWDTREEAIALVLAYCADAISQALEEHNKTHNGPDSLYVPRLSMDAKVAQAVQASWEPRCGETGKLSLRGVCPEHGGDACLMASAIVQAVQTEREACAQVVLAMRFRPDAEEPNLVDSFLDSAARKIRARSTEPTGKTE